MEASDRPEPREGETRGFFSSLFDTRFGSLITPSLIRFIYIVTMVVLAIGIVVGIITGFADSAGTGVLALVLAPIIALIYLIIIRLWLELVIVAFKIRDAAEEIATNTRRP